MSCGRQTRRDGDGHEQYGYHRKRSRVGGSDSKQQCGHKPGACERPSQADGDTNSPLVHVTVPDRNKFLSALEADKNGDGDPKWAVNRFVDKKFGDHKADTIRQVGKGRDDYSMHFANDNPKRPGEYQVHIDITSVYHSAYGIGGPLAPWEVGADIKAGERHHHEQVTPGAERAFLMRTGQVPNGEK
jgi:hypothetical protein